MILAKRQLRALLIILVLSLLQLSNAASTWAAGDSGPIPETPNPINLDGRCLEYAGAELFDFVDFDQSLRLLYMQQDRENLYVCITGAPSSFGDRSFSVHIDTDNGKERIAEADDLALHIRVSDGVTQTYRGTGDPGPSGWEAVAQPTTPIPNEESVEFRIPFSLLSETCGASFGLAVYHRNVPDNGIYTGWPNQVGPDFPGTWETTTLQNPRCIRVCRDEPTACLPATDAVIRDANNQDMYAVDDQGFVLDRPSIADGDEIWATDHMTDAASYTVYQTSGPPKTVNDKAFAGDTPGTMTLVVSKEHPLILHDFDFSAQWYIQGDPVYADRISNDIAQASAFLYDFTDGQMALRRVTIHQDFARWNEADGRIYASNNLRPEADAGGVVKAPTPDPDDPSILYHPGETRMGATWNRFNLPETPPGLGIDTSNDWAKVLAHELGHYLLFLQDTYYRLAADGTIQNVYTCVGSAMGWVYEPDNSEFVGDQGFWDANCKDTFGNEKLGRHEWNTLRSFYPWFVPPTASAVDLGPGKQPDGLTSIEFITPAPATAPLPNQLFDLQYRDGEKASAQARAFVFRHDRVLDQGQPPAGGTQMDLHGAQETDRLCVIDIAPSTVPPDTPRHQFGCEILATGDNALFLEKDVAWAPLITLTPLTSVTMGISVTQLVAGVDVKARLYPEDTDTPTEIDLTGAGDQLVGIFPLPEFTPSGYIQVWADETSSETDPRREAIVDYGTGAGGLPGPRRKGASAPVMYSPVEGNFIGDPDLSLDEGEFLAWQSLSGPPVPPPGTQVVGPAHGLIALPADKTQEGSISIRHGSPGAMLASASSPQQNDLSIYYWDGKMWQELISHTSEPTGFQLASAPSRGVGIYALARRNNAEQGLYLPSISRP